MSTHSDDVFKTILDGVRVLVVEGSAETRASLEQLLTLHGANLIQAETVSEVGGALETTPPDVIVADEDGADVVVLVRDRQPSGERPVPVIALTAAGNEDDNEALVEAGCHAVLCKPFDPDKLITLVAASVGRC